MTAAGGEALWYPPWKRALKRWVAVPVLGAQLLMLTSIITGLYAVWISIHDSELHSAVKTLLVVLVSAAWGILVEFFNWHVFHRLASALNRTRARKEALQPTPDGRCALTNPGLALRSLTGPACSGALALGQPTPD